MPKRWILMATAIVSLFAAAKLRAQGKPFRQAWLADMPAVAAGSGAVVDEITFRGLRRISPRTLASLIVSRSGEPLDAAKVEQDVRTLARTAWLESVRADVESFPTAVAGSSTGPERLKLIFYVPEMPFLTKVEYGGSQLLSQVQIKKLLEEKKLTPKLGEPENPVALEGARRAIESTLADLAHPHGRVKLLREESAQATVRVRFEISDGPHVPVGRVLFEGNPAISQGRLTKQMRRLSPGSFLAGVRGKNAYTSDAFEEDRERLLAYYKNHGYPEARIGTARTYEYDTASCLWIPFPHKSPKTCLAVIFPVQAGALYRTEPVTTTAELEQAVGLQGSSHLLSSKSTAAPVYSTQHVENLRRIFQARLQEQAKRKNAAPMRAVTAIPTMDTTAHSVRITLGLSPSPSYTVRRLEFRGLHHFPDRYLRTRVGVTEGEPLDDRALEAGLRRLTRTGYFKPIKNEDIQVIPNDAAHTIDLAIRIEELGLQRVSMVGGRGQFGSTLGIAYSLFNILDREELLTSKIEGGPETLQLALGLVKEGFLGSRGSLALSVFNTFLRPRLEGTVKGPFYEQSTTGVSADWSYALSNANTLTANYTLSHSLTSYSSMPSTGLAVSDVRSESSSHAIATGWTRDTGTERIAFAGSVSGGWLGGSENLVRSHFEYARLLHDPFLGRNNAWAFRTTFTGVGSYSDDPPLTARLFAGDTYVRGLRDGDLGPSAAVASTSSNGTTNYSTSPTGANLIGAMNAEYRVKLTTSAEAAGFFDVGSGLLVPNWLGHSRPSLINSTNGILHASTGLELRWTLPGVGVPVRAYYALNVLRLNRPAWMPDGSLLHVHNQFAAFGWGLGSLF